jgi:RHS repeat-associated protein
MNPTGYAQVLCEYQYTGTNAPALQRSYTYGLDLVSHRLPGGATTKKYYSTDALGTTRFLTGTTGTTVAALVTSNYHYDAFGTLLGSSPTLDTAYLYTGEQWDGDVGAYYLRARWYHPGLGRFLERDSYEGDDSDPITLNRFIYCNAAPVNNVDPSGFFTIQRTAECFGNTKLSWSPSRSIYRARIYSNPQRPGVGNLARTIARRPCI